MLLSHRPKTLTLFMTKIWHFPYPIYDETKIMTLPSREWETANLMWWESSWSRFRGGVSLNLMSWYPLAPSELNRHINKQTNKQASKKKSKENTIILCHCLILYLVSGDRWTFTCQTFNLTYFRPPPPHFPTLSPAPVPPRYTSNFRTYEYWTEI